MANIKTNTIIISAVKGIAGLAARFGDNDIVAQTFDISEVCGEPSENTATFALQAISTVLENFSNMKLEKGTYHIMVQDQVALRLVGIPSNLKNGGVDAATSAAVKNNFVKEHEDLLAGIVYLVAELQKKGINVYFSNARSLLQYEIQATGEFALKKGDIVEMDHSTSTDGKFICRDNSYVTGTYEVDVVSIKRPDGSIREKYMINRHNNFGELGELNGRDIVKLLGSEEGAASIMKVANEKGDSAVKWVANLALYRAVISLLPKIKLSENFNKVSANKLF